MESKRYSLQNLVFIQITFSYFPSGIEGCCWQNCGGCRFSIIVYCDRSGRGSLQYLAVNKWWYRGDFISNGKCNQTVHTNIASTGAENATNEDNNGIDLDSVKKTIKMAEMKTAPVVATRVTRYYFVDNYTSGIMVHAITKEVVVAPRQRDTKTMWC